MSLRDDLDVVMYVSDADATKEAYLRLRAALTPASEKWLEALPELLELLEADSRSTYIRDHVTKRALFAALHEAAALHNATNDKEQK